LHTNRPPVSDFCKAKNLDKISDQACLSLFLAYENKNPNSAYRGMIENMPASYGQNPMYSVRYGHDEILEESYIIEYIENIQESMNKTWDKLEELHPSLTREEFEYMYMATITRVFGSPDKGIFMNPYGDLINTNKNKLQNVIWKYDNKNGRDHIFVAKRNIKKDEELFTSYMPEWSNLKFFSHYGFTIPEESNRYEHLSLIEVNNGTFYCDEFKIEFPPSLTSYNLDVRKDEEQTLDCLERILKTLEKQMETYPTKLEVRIVFIF
jgi:hypothetical protein